MIVVDVETTGLDPSRHSIVSIGAVSYENPDCTFYTECRPWTGTEIDDRALQVNGFTRAQLLDVGRPLAIAAIRRFDAWARSSPLSMVLANHNVAFDVGFLQMAYDRANLEWPFGYKTVDVHAVAYAAMLACGANVPLKADRTSDLSLDGILTWLGLDPEPKPHHALNGARCAATALRRLTHGSVSIPRAISR